MLEINTRDVHTETTGAGTKRITREKSEVVLAVDIANAAVDNAVKGTGRCATLVKELTEAEAVLELMNKKFKLLHFDTAEATEQWLKDTRAARYALEGEFRGIAKTLADIAEYFGRADVKRTTAELRELCEVVERISKLNADPATTKLIEAVLARG